MSSVEIWVDHYKAQSAGLVGAGIPWLDALRERAIDRFSTIGWPTNRQDGWRHTSLALLQQQSFETPAKDHDTGAIKNMMAQLRQDQSGHWMVFVDGQFMPDLSDIGTLPEGAHVMPVSQALQSRGDQVQDLVGDEEDGPTPAALNMAMAGDGGFISLSRGVALELPVQLVFITASAKCATFPRNVIAAEQGASATVVEHYVSTVQGDEDNAAVTLTNAVTRTRVASDATITHMKLQLENEQAFHLASIHADQAEKSTFNSHSM